MKNKIKNLIFDSNKGKVKLNERASIFFFCITLSTFFWFLSSLSKEYTTKLTLPLTYKGFNKNFILVEEPINFIEIQVSANGFELLGEQMSLNRNAIEVDLAQAIRLSENRFGLATSKLQNNIYQFLDKDIKFERITLDSIIFTTDKRVIRKLKVLPKLDISFESSYNLVSKVTVDPEYVEVSGAKSQLDSLTFITTSLINLEGVNDSLSINYSFNEDERLKDLNVVPNSVELSIPVTKFTEKSFEVPVTWSGDYSIRTFPNKVKLVFLVPLSNYEQLTANTITAQVNLNESIETKSKLAVTVVGVPNFAKHMRTEPEKVEFIIKQ